MIAKDVSERSASSLGWIPQVASASAVLVGCLVLVGWWFNVGILKNPFAGFPAVRVTTALSFVLIGSSLWLLRVEFTNALSRRLAQVCASIVVVIGLLALSEHLIWRDVEIDQPLLQERGVPVPHANSGRMALVSALNFLLLGSALLLLDVKSSHDYQPSEHLAVAGAMSALLTVVAYLYGGATVHQIYPFATVAPHAALLFIALSIGVLFARSQHGVVGVMTSDTVAGGAMRRLLVVAILFPVFMGWLRLMGERLGFYGTEFGLAVMVLFAIITLTASIYWQATSLIQAEEYQRGINEVAIVLSQATTLEHAFPVFAATIKKIVPYDRICVVVREGETLVATLSVADPALPCYQGKAWRSSGDTAVDWVIAHKTPRLVQDLSLEQSFADEAFVARERIRSALILPLLVGGEAVGSITLDSRTLGAYTQDHVTVLTGFMEPLAAAIRNAHLHAQVLHYTHELERLVEVRTRELQTANGHLAEASRHKSAFLANMSHELRTPLNSILGFSDLLRDQISGPLTAKQARYADHIHTSGTHLLALINDLLDLSKVEAGKLTLHPEPFDLNEALAASVHDIQPLADAKPLTLTLDVKTAPITLIADPVRFKQIVYNLLSNAVKFTPEDGRITVAVRVRREASGEKKDLAEITVTDTGIGIAEEDLPKLFERFSQLETGATKRFQGSGLGLALTKQLVELHGGTIEAASAGAGQGSTFTVRLPLAQPARSEH